MNMTSKSGSVDVSCVLYKAVCMCWTGNNRGAVATELCL